MAERPSYWLTRFLFLRLLGLVYAVAFLVILYQWPPLLGSRGLLPAREFLDAVGAEHGRSFSTVLSVPTLFWLFYDVGEDYVAKRAHFRRAHLEEAWAAHARGELLLAGALADPVDGAVLLFKGDSKDVPTRFAESDPYVVNGLVTGWRIREWTTVAGDRAADPIRPDRADISADRPS